LVKLLECGPGARVEVASPIAVCRRLAALSDRVRVIRAGRKCWRAVRQGTVPPRATTRRTRPKGVRGHGQPSGLGGVLAGASEQGLPMSEEYRADAVVGGVTWRPPTSRRVRRADTGVGYIRFAGISRASFGLVAMSGPTSSVTSAGGRSDHTIRLTERRGCGANHDRYGPHNGRCGGSVGVAWLETAHKPTPTRGWLAAGLPLGLQICRWSGAAAGTFLQWCAVARSALRVGASTVSGPSCPGRAAGRSVCPSRRAHSATSLPAFSVLSRRRRRPGCLGDLDPHVEVGLRFAKNAHVFITLKRAGQRPRVGAGDDCRIWSAVVRPQPFSVGSCLRSAVTLLVLGQERV